ncbi:MAG: hypothetical protein ACOYL3_28430 [Desulfuromonadaceae bacterium]
MQDFRIKTRAANTACLNELKNSKFLAINHTSITFEKDAYKGNKRIPTRFTLIRPLSTGWGAAPYKQNTKSIGAKKLSELNFLGAQPVMKMWSFEKVSSNMEKGPRVDDINWELRAGNTLIFWLDEQRVREIREKQNIEKIEAFTVCEVQISTRNTDSVAKGSGVKIVEIKPCNFSLYSCIADLDNFAPTLADARTQELKAQQTFPQIARDLVPENPAFHVHVHHKAFFNDDDTDETGFVRLLNWGGSDTIDIPLCALAKYTNLDPTHKLTACNLLEIAIATNALQLLVFSNDFWRSPTESHLRAIPIINTENLLHSVIPALIGTQTTFQTPHDITIDETTYHIQIHVDPEPLPVAKGPPPFTQDLAITGLNVELERAYKITFSLISAEDEIPKFFEGYFNASPNRTVSALGYKRRRLVSCEDDQEQGALVVARPRV